MITAILLLCIVLQTQQLPLIEDTDIVEGSSDRSLTDSIEESNVIGEGSGSLEGQLESDELLTTKTDFCAKSTMPNEMKDMIVSRNNHLRSLLAAGLNPNKEGLMQTGRNIYKLSWDCELESIVRDYIVNCTSMYMPNNITKSSSQVIKTFWTFFDGKNVTQNIIISMNDWWNSSMINGNDDPKNRYFSAKQFYAWANMAKGKSTRIGCSYQECPSEEKAVFSCLFDEKAQCERDMIYEPGKACVSNEDCFTYPGSKCVPEEGLCIAPEHTDDDGISEMCNNPKMTDAVRKAALDQHNFYRSRLAFGREWNGETNTTQPSASTMLKMEYDCDLEQYAQEWAEVCVFAHSANWERPNQGQNLYMTSFNSFDPRSLLHTAIEKWWQELEEFGMPADNILSDDVWDKKGRLIGHFTQMAWDRTWRLGCAVVSCPNMGYVVCHYGPGGNRKGRSVYRMGSPCQTDSECPTNSTCLAKEGLCAISSR